MDAWLGRFGVVRLAGAGLLLAMAMLSAADAAPDSHAGAVLTVEAQPVGRRPMVHAVVGTGSVVPWQELVVGSEVNGLRVMEVTFEEGDTVAKGQLMVRLDDSVLRAQLAQAQAAEAEAEANLAFARSDVARGRELAQRENIARQTVEQRETTARANEAKLAQARAQRDQLEAQLAQTRILAPEAGIVSKRSVLVGAVVAQGTELFRLIRDGRLELDAQLPELDLAQVRPGQAVRVTHGSEPVGASVRAVAPTVAADTRLGIVHVALPRDSGLSPGMYARAEIAVGQAEVVAVPQEAVVFRDGRPSVFVLSTDDHVALRPIVTGERREGWVEVTGGLAAGERIVVNGAGFLNDGDHVTVADSVAAAGRR